MFKQISVKAFSHAVFGLSLLALSACQGLPTSPMARLGNPTDLDPAEVKFAVRGPSVLQVRDSDFKLTVRFEHPSLAQPIEKSYSLEQDTATPLPQAVETGLKPEEHAEVFGFGPATIKALRQLKQEMQQRRTESEPGKGSIAVGIGGGCKTGPLPKGPLYISVYAQTHQDQGFFEMIPQMDLRQLMQANGVKDDAIPDCKA